MKLPTDPYPSKMKPTHTHTSPFLLELLPSPLPLLAPPWGGGSLLQSDDDYGDFEEDDDDNDDNEEDEDKEEDWYKISYKKFSPDPVLTLDIPHLI